MELSVPDNYATYMLKMTFDTYCDKYYPFVFDEDKYNDDMEKYKVGTLDVEPKKGRYNKCGVSSKKMRNNYDARMRPTNLYIRFLEHKINVLEVANKKK